MKAGLMRAQAFGGNITSAVDPLAQLSFLSASERMPATYATATTVTTTN